MIGMLEGWVSNTEMSEDGRWRSSLEDRMY